MSPLSIKLVRELWKMRAQALAIALVVAGGTSTLILSTTTLQTLTVTQTRFYSEQQFADVFADLKRAPERVALRIARIPGIAQVETRVVAMVQVRVTGYDDPVSGLILSLPDGGPQLLNRLYMLAGEAPGPEQRDGVVLSEAFAQAHGLEVGGTIGAVINGRWENLRITGIALSPEHIYQIRPGDMFPDFQRYGILWMRREALASAYDMDGAFNNLVATLAPDASPEIVIDAIDGALSKYGGAGAYARKDQLSNRYLTQEIQGLKTMAAVFPVIFLGVAAYLLNIVLARMVHLEREEIGMLKAFGYSNAAVALHYLQFVLAITTVGLLLGTAAGTWLGRAMSGIFQEYYRFPYLDFSLSLAPIAIAMLVTFAAALIGALRALRRVANLPPAEAMRPPTPTVYRRSVLAKSALAQRLDQPSRMIVRHLGRWPLRALLTLLGIALSVGIMVVGSFQQDAIGYMTHVQFDRAALETMTVSFNEPRSRNALFALQTLPGVNAVQPFRAAGVRLRNGDHQYRTALVGLTQSAPLHRVLDTSLRVVTPPEDGLLLTGYLADLLFVHPGDSLIVEFLEGRRRVRNVRVAGVVDEYVGLSAYMELDALNRLSGDGDVISGAYLDHDEHFEKPLLQALDEAPAVAAITVKQRAVESFMNTMEETILAFSLVNALLAMSIAFGVIYSTANIAFSERSHELASLRVLGLTRGEVSYVLLGELGLLVLAALIPGFLIGKAFCTYMADSISSEIYRVPVVIELSTYTGAAVGIISAAVVSALIVKRRLDRADLVAVLKIQE